MSKPDIIPETSLSGISVDPRTLERVIPESRRPDGTVRKEIKIRPGFTPQEDVKRFRGSKQQQMDTNVLPKGHIIGWSPSPAAAQSKSTAGLSKSAKKNEKRKEKRKEKALEKAADKVKDSWEDDDEEDSAAAVGKQKPPITAAKESTENKQAVGSTDALAEKLEKLDVR